MWRRVLFAAAAVTVTGLQVTDLPDRTEEDPEDERMQLIGSQTVSALDPELKNTAGETFHVTVNGTWPLVELPKGTGTEVSLNGTIVNMTGAKRCSDLLIRQIDLSGSKLGSNISKLEFYVGSDIFNDTATLGLAITTPNGIRTEYDPYTFLQLVPFCQIVRPREEVALPKATSYRKRTRIFKAVCDLDRRRQVITMHWSTVWRGFNRSAPNPLTGTYLNDMDVFMSGVGSDPGGLLGPDDHTDATVLVSGCPKKQPMEGPYQTRRSAR